MRIIHDLNELEDRAPSAITLGTFDGVHLGHRSILNVLHSTAVARRLRSILITFEPHPQLVLRPHRIPELKLLTTTEEKLELLKASSVDVCLVMKFTADIASMTGETFVQKILFESLGMRVCILGHDHAFGKNRSAHYDTVKNLGRQLGFDVVRIEPVQPSGQLISSTVIRNLIREGDVAKANGFLGRPYGISGAVIEGAKRGRQIGFPTANIDVPDHKLVPKNGVYACLARIGDQSIKAMVNIGVRPTFNNVALPTVEAHLLDWSGNLYGMRLELLFLERIRDERRFESVDALRDAIQDDVKIALKQVFTNI